MAGCQPVISVDTKKKELVGDFKNGKIGVRQNRGQTPFSQAMRGSKFTAPHLPDQILEAGQFGPSVIDDDEAVGVIAFQFFNVFKNHSWSINHPFLVNRTNAEGDSGW